jgi:hypothetical protein
MKYNPLRPYLSLILLFAPAVLFGVLMVLYWQHPKLGILPSFPFVPWQFLLLGVAGVVATTGGVLDWRYHRNPLNMKIPKKDTPLSIVCFYIVEVQWMFLFPLLIDQSPAPLRESIAMTRNIGTINAVWVILPIGVFMLLGLFYWKNPLKHWYLGCLAVVIGYMVERNK